eukprot:4297863-Heterocapsa_arctica.AAC.1
MVGAVLRGQEGPPVALRQGGSTTQRRGQVPGLCRALGHAHAPGAGHDQEVPQRGASSAHNSRVP